MRVRQIELTARSAQFVSKELKAGHYRDESEVLEAGLKLLEAKQERQKQKRAKLRSLIKAGTDQLEQGQYTVIQGKEELKNFIQKLGKRARGQVRSRK